MTSPVSKPESATAPEEALGRTTAATDPAPTDRSLLRGQTVCAAPGDLGPAIGARLPCGVVLLERLRPGVYLGRLAAHHAPAKAPTVEVLVAPRLTPAADLDLLARLPRFTARSPQPILATGATDRGLGYLVRMPRAEGEPMQLWWRPGGRPSAAELGRMAHRLARALGQAHAEGLTHGAVDLHHILVQPEPTRVDLFGWGEALLAGRASTPREDVDALIDALGTLDHERSIPWDDLPTRDGAALLGGLESALGPWVAEEPAAALAALAERRRTGRERAAAQEERRVWRRRWTGRLAGFVGAGAAVLGLLTAPPKAEPEKPASAVLATNDEPGSEAKPAPASVKLVRWAPLRLRDTPLLVSLPEGAVEAPLATAVGGERYQARVAMAPLPSGAVVGVITSAWSAELGPVERWARVELARLLEDSLPRGGDWQSRATTLAGMPGTATTVDDPDGRWASAWIGAFGGHAIVVVAAGDQRVDRAALWARLTDSVTRL